MPKLTEAQVKKHNREVTRFLVQRLTKIPSQILGRLTNATVRAAVTNTYQDSGKFAWNWKVQWAGNADLGSGTNDPGYGEGPVGFRNENRGTGDRRVIRKLHDEIKFNTTNFGSGQLYKQIVKDNPTQVRVFNPFYSGLYGQYAAEGKAGVRTKKEAKKKKAKLKPNVPIKVEEAVGRESARVKYEIRYKGLGE